MSVCHGHHHKHRQPITIKAAAATASSSFKVKICGITSADDATLAASAGAAFVGLIAWPKAKRSVSTTIARDIANAAREHGAIPIAVFVDETAEQMAEYCSAAGIDHAQLHGDAARTQLPDLPAWLHVVYVAQAAQDGTLQTAAPRDCCSNGQGIARNRCVCCACGMHTTQSTNTTNTMPSHDAQDTRMGACRWHDGGIGAGV